MIYVAGEIAAALRDDRQRMAWVCVSVFVRCEGEWGVLSCVVMKEKSNILHHVPHHTFPHWLGLFKSCCQPCLTASLSLRLGWWELPSTVWRRLTASLLSRKVLRGNWVGPDLQCDMLLSINVLVLLLLQLALSSPVPLTTPSRGCPTCKPKPMQTQASEVLNATSPGIGGQCGVYTLSCALGLRCTPPPGEPRPLRALLEGRGVCSNASSIGPTANTHLAGKSFLLCVCMQKGSTDRRVSFLFWARHSSVLLASAVLSLTPRVETFLQLTCIGDKCLMPTSMSLFNLRSGTHGGSEWGKTFFFFATSQMFPCLNKRADDLRFLWQGPCRRLLTTLIKGLDAHLFDSQHDIYMPNCDKRGFFRKKQARAPPKQMNPWTHAAPACVAQINICVDTCQNQPKLYFCSSVQCWSSRGKRRGQCWCVDQNGMQVSSNTGEKGSLVC